MKVVRLPKNLKIFKKVDYPPHNIGFNLEGEITKRLLESAKNIETNLKFLPIQWTNYFIKNKYGKNLSELEKYNNKKLKNKKNNYFTVIQYADGHLVETENILFFSASGLDKKLLNKSTSYIKIPLIAEEHKKLENNVNKKYIASFIGRNTHDVRTQMKDVLNNEERFKINVFSSPVINEENQHIFKNLMEKSYFSLCPRGYGVTSYRLFESFQFSTVPVYISEEKDYYLPFEDIIDWEKLCVLQDINSIKHLPKRLNDIINSGKYKSMLEYGAYCNNNFFNYDFITKYIIEKIESF